MIVTGTSDDALRLETALAIGATHTVAVDVDNPRELVNDLTGGAGADVVFDIASVAATVPMALDLVRFRGRVLLAGLKHFAEIPGFISDTIVMKSLTVSGGTGYTPESMAESVAMLERGDVRADLVTGEVLDIEHIEEAMTLLERKDPTHDAVRVGLRHATAASRPVRAVRAVDGAPRVVEIDDPVADDGIRRARRRHVEHLRHRLRARGHGVRGLHPRPRVRGHRRRCALRGRAVDLLRRVRRSVAPATRNAARASTRTSGCSATAVSPIVRAFPRTRSPRSPPA